MTPPGLSTILGVHGSPFLGQRRCFDIHNQAWIEIVPCIPYSRIMLNTFQNAERHQLRRKEREQHLHNMDAIVNHSVFSTADDQNLAPSQAADNLIGIPLRKTPSSDRNFTISGNDNSISPAGLSCYNGGKIRFRLLIGAGLLLILVLATILAVRDHQVAPGTDTIWSDQDQNLNSNDQSASSTLDRSSVRYKRIFSLLLDWQVSPKADLQDGSSTAFRALEWLVSDPVELSDVEAIRTRFSLAVLYFSMHENNMKWKNEQHWLSAYPVCLWHGITCRGDDDTVERVHSINLADQGLAGTIPRELSLLELDIHFMDLSSNRVTGSIPSEIGVLKNMQHIYLGPSNITSSIPESLYHLSHLTHLYLNDCQLTGTLSESISSMTSLQGLGLHNNYLNGPIPTTVGILDDLRVLYLDENALTGTIPTSLGKLENLVDLRLRRNHLRGSIPTQLSSLRVLQILYADNNQLTGTIPAGLGNLLLLRELQLYHNRLDGIIPESFSSLVLLAILYLDGNLLSGSIPNLSNSRFLESIYLSDNDLTGNIPPSLGSLQYLKHVKLGGNRLANRLPSELGQLEKLQTLDVSVNLLDGTVPETLTRMTSVTEVRLHSNHLVGSIPFGPTCRADLQLSADCLEVDCDCCTTCYD